MGSVGRFLAVVLTLLLFTKAAFAQSPAEDAKRRGDDAMVALRYEEALKEYRSAFEATQNPALLYNMGRAYEGLADFPKALDALEQFTSNAPPDLKARVPKLDELVRDVRNRVATLVVNGTIDGAEIRLGERVVGATKNGQTTFRVNSGKQHLTVQKEGYFPFDRDLPLVGGGIETVNVRLGAKSSMGLVHVTSPVAGANVAVDGKSIGAVPTDASLTPGSHKVLVRGDGYDAVETNVIVAAGEKKDLDVKLAKSASILGKWWFWTAVGVVVAGGVATAIALTTERSPDTGTIAPGQVKAELHF